MARTLIFLGGGVTITLRGSPQVTYGKEMGRAVWSIYGDKQCTDAV